MSDYPAVQKELERGTPPELLCATCPWDRLCVTPPSMTAQEVQKQIDDAEAKDRAKDPEMKGMPVGMLMTTLALAGRDKQAELCPVFALRLRGPDGRQVSDGIRGMMRIEFGEAKQ